jgi:hypothetical protein
MAFKRFSSKARRAIRPTGSKIVKKAARSRFGFKKFEKAYPSAIPAWNQMVARRTPVRYPQRFKPRGVSYGVLRPHPMNLPMVVDLSKNQTRLIPSTYKSMDVEDELSYSISSRVSSNPESQITSVRLIWNKSMTIFEMISSVLKNDPDRFKEVVSVPYITFEKLSIKMRLYSHPVSGVKPYHGYEWAPASTMEEETDLKIPATSPFGKSYNGKGYMATKFNVSGFIKKNGGSPYVRLNPDMDLQALKESLNLAPFLRLYAHHPTEEDTQTYAPEVGHLKIRLFYRLHHNLIKKEINQPTLQTNQLQRPMTFNRSASFA